jgi:pyrimidine-nucleoside phosphorylase
MSLLPAELIRKKRRGEAHDRGEIEFLVRGFTSGEVPDYQMAAWLMAVCFRSLSSAETAWLTECMIHSGQTLEFKIPGKIAVDKHSTGGVGDKTSLIIAPLTAAAGVPVPMMAGRGLGHTGGTLDKLEAIPGFNVRLNLDAFKKLVVETGTAIIGQTKEICPADLKLYALRDVTATIDSIPLICASIMSKKLAEGVGGLVLDVKFGSGAFMKTAQEAEVLAKTLVEIGRFHGLKITAFLTSMEQPLGRFAGNSVEVQECMDILQGRTCEDGGVDFYADTRELSLRLAAAMLVLGGQAADAQTARATCEELLRSGAAWRKFREICENQGAKPGWELPRAGHEAVVTSPGSGYVAQILCEEVGLAGIELGAGRRRAEDEIDHAAGIEVLVKLGQKVEKGQPLFRLLAGRKDVFAGATARLAKSVRIGPKPPAPVPLIHAQITEQGVFYG